VLTLVSLTITGWHNYPIPNLTFLLVTGTTLCRFTLVMVIKRMTMKTKYTLLTGLAMLAITAAFGQVEHDDMYFNAKDRAQQNAFKEVVLAKQYKQQDAQAVKSAPINPTDSYSGRSVNPEYTNRLKTNPNLGNSDTEYFVSGYQPVTLNQKLAGNNCNCNINTFGGFGMNQGFGSPYNNFYSPWGMNGGFGSPYGGFNSPWGMNSGFQAFQPGWSSMLGFSFGSMNSWGNPWNNYGYGGGYFPYNNYGFGMPYGGYGSSYYGNNMTIVNNGGDYRNPVVYGKRANRSSDTNNTIDYARPETNVTRTGREFSTGRSRSESESQYYDRNWKRDPDKNPSRAMWSDNTSNNQSSGTRTGWTNGSSNSAGRQNSDWGNSNSSRSSYDGGSRSSSGGSVSGGSSSSSGSSGGSRSRGRD